MLTIDMLHATVSLTLLLLLLYALQANSPGTPCTKLTAYSCIPPPLLAAAATEEHYSFAFQKCLFFICIKVM